LACDPIVRRVSFIGSSDGVHE
jgi:hypothetical protein